MLKQHPTKQPFDPKFGRLTTWQHEHLSRSCWHGGEVCENKTSETPEIFAKCLGT